MQMVSVTGLRTAGTHDPIQRIEFMNAPKVPNFGLSCSMVYMLEYYILKRDLALSMSVQSSVVHEVNE